MKIFVMTVMFVMALAIAVVQFLRNKKHGAMVDDKARYSPFVYLSAALLVISDVGTGGGCGPRLLLCMMPSLACMSMMTSSMWESGQMRRWMYGFITAGLVMSVYGFLCSFGVTPCVPDGLSLAMLLGFMTIHAAIFLTGLVRRLKSIKAVMKAGTVWTNVRLGVDAVYLVIEAVILIMYLSVCVLSGRTEGAHAIVFTLLLGGQLAAYGCRIMTDSLFVIWRKQEQKILESIKVTNVESASDVSRIDEVYREIYERVVAYFEREKPFLDCDLTINDLTKVLYSNKLYISRAISQFTGRNFCQFVNYYRIKFSTECFKANHDLKIHELSSMSGFNSIVTFNTAFRLYMGENPSDWCRKEKGRFIKGKK